jgi:hypothetical protein
MADFYAINIRLLELEMLVIPIWWRNKKGVADLIGHATPGTIPFAERRSYCCPPTVSPGDFTGVVSFEAFSARSTATRVAVTAR